MDNGQVVANNVVADQAWFHAPVDVDVEQDNRVWLDELMKMKPEEMLNYAVYNYQVPEAAAKALIEANDRTGIIQLIVNANRAGGGTPVGMMQYMYFKDFDGLLEPMVSKFNEQSDPLYLVRGSGHGLSVYDRGANKWHNVEQFRQQHGIEAPAQKPKAAPSPDKLREAAIAAADSVANHPSQQLSPARELKPVIMDSIAAVVPTLKGEQLRSIAAELGITDLENQEVFPNNKSISDKILEVNAANKEFNSVGTTQDSLPTTPSI